MSAIPLKIFLHGLIALVPTIDSGGNHLTALLVDGRMAMQGQCMVEHNPKLRFFVAKTADCVSVSGCTISVDQCTCMHDTANGVDPLAGKQIWLDFQPDPLPAPSLPKGALPTPSLPSTTAQAASFSYIANLSQEPMKLAVDPIYLASNPSPAARTHLVARMDVPYNSVTSCSLATREDNGLTKIHALSFRKLHSPSQSDEVSYAMAQKVVAELMVPDGGTIEQTVNLHFSDFDGTNDHSFTLKPDKGAYRIDVGNDPEASLDRDDSCDDGVARHFSHFYELALTVPEEEKLPHVRPTQFTPLVGDAKDLQPVACQDPDFGLDARPICPMVTFNP
jgi:hypothetical protein